jgi:hypothetical protein
MLGFPPKKGTEVRINRPAHNQARHSDLSPGWEKLKVLSVVFSSLAVPIVLAILGNIWTKSQKQDEIGVRYVELATGILRAPPSEQTKTLRLWAISVVDHYSQVPLPASAKEELQRQQLEEQMRAMTSYMQRQIEVQQDAMRQQQLKMGQNFAEQQRALGALPLEQQRALGALQAASNAKLAK